MRLSSIITLLSVSFAAAKDLTKNERHSVRSASRASDLSADELHKLLVERNSLSSKPSKNKLSSSVETGMDASCRDSPKGWYDAGGSTFDCEYYEDYNKCGEWGYKYENMGKTANEACCTCGGGKRTCSDSPRNWYDKGGPPFDCEWYAEESDRCKVWGDMNRNRGKTANEACCTCGGGDRGNNDPTCEDTYGWKDSLGDGCSFYEKGFNCEDYGDDFRNMGETANEACCACGGGNTNKRFVTKVEKAIIMTKEERDAHSKTKNH
jgi:hypothetical protein